jgi:hypothetical protein
MSMCKMQKQFCTRFSKGILAYARSNIILMSHLWEKKSVVTSRLVIIAKHHDQALYNNF